MFPWGYPFSLLDYSWSLVGDFERLTTVAEGE
jgi:hypothetical protein